MRTIQHKRGVVANLPTLAEGELGFTTDEKVLYIGHTDGNVRVTTDLSEYPTIIQMNTAINNAIGNAIAGSY